MNISRIRRKREARTQRKFVELMIVADSREVSKNKYISGLHLVIRYT